VLVAGGGANGTSAELYDPTTGTWSPTGSTRSPRRWIGSLCDSRLPGACHSGRRAWRWKPS